jgi:hypothetical protein
MAKEQEVKYAEVKIETKTGCILSTLVPIVEGEKFIWAAANGELEFLFTAYLQHLKTHGWCDNFEQPTDWVPYGQILRVRFDYHQTPGTWKR